MGSGKGAGPRVESRRRGKKAERSTTRQDTMINDEGQNVDPYIPRKCSWSNRLIGAKDHSAIQINIGHLDDKGVFTGKCTTFAIGGAVRHRGESDSGLDHLWSKKKAEIGQ